METEQLLQKVCETFYYDNGVLHYRGAPYQPKDTAPGWVKPDTKYHMVNLCGKQYKTHRLIYLMHHGNLPELIDHIDRDKLNNRIENLRASNKSLNAINSKRSDAGGVSYRADRGRWQAYIKRDYKQEFIGYFNTEHEAREAVERRKYGQDCL